MEKQNHYCRVCGLYSEEMPWGDDGNTPAYIICDCCGAEAGYEDYTIESTREYREKWISNGLIWFNSKNKPVNWNLAEQMTNIPESFQ